VHARSVSRLYWSSGIRMFRLLGVILASSRVHLRCSAHAQMSFTKPWMGSAMMTTTRRCREPTLRNWRSSRAEAFVYLDRPSGHLPVGLESSIRRCAVLALEAIESIHH